MNFVLLHLYTFDIEDLMLLYNNKTCSEDKKKNFAFYGLLKDDGITDFVDRSLVIKQKYALNDFGKKFVEAIKEN